MSKSMQTLFIGTILILVLVIIAWINVQQSWDFFQKLENIERLEKLQNTLYQNNKRLFVKINELESPERIMEIIDKNPEWNLRYMRSSDITLIYPSPEKAENESL